VATSLHTGPFKNLQRGALFSRDLRNGYIRTLETECLPLWELCKGYLEGGHLYWKPQSYVRYVKEGFGNGASLSL
jgi:hypothetical protein